MKQVFFGEIYEALPLSNGIIFSYCKEILDEGVVVSYKMISFETGRFTDVAKNIYLLTKFGNNYKAVLELVGNYITVKSILLPGSKLFLMNEDGFAQLLDSDITPLWTGYLAYRGDAPSDIVLHDNALWAVYSQSNVLLKYNLATMKEELRIGGGVSPFNKPQSLFVEGNKIMVSNSGSNNLIEIDLNSYSVFEFEKFAESVFQYIKVGDYRFAVLASGIYLI